MAKRKRKMPYTAFSEVATLAGEMMLASAFVMTHRTQLMSKAGKKPSRSDQQEMTRMVQEKAEAGQEAVFAIGRYMAGGRGVTAQGLAKAAIRPFHKRAKANAKRLRKQP